MWPWKNSTSIHMYICMYVDESVPYRHVSVCMYACILMHSLCVSVRVCVRMSVETYMCSCTYLLGLAHTAKPLLNEETQQDVKSWHPDAHARHE